MKRIITVVVLFSLLACVALSASAAEMKKAVILDFPQDETRQFMMEHALTALAKAGFTSQQTIDILIVHDASVEREMEMIKAAQPAVVIDLSTRQAEHQAALQELGVPTVFAYGIETLVQEDGTPTQNITGVYSTLKDMVFNSYKFLMKVSPLKPGQQVVFLQNPAIDLIPRTQVEDALKRLNIPLKAIVDTTVYENWQDAIITYNDDPDVGWVLMGVWPTVKRDGTATDMHAECAPWQREHLKKPMITYWESAVQLGILSGFGIDLREVGAQCGEMAARILKGADVKTIKAEYPRQTFVALNRKTADVMGIIFPPDVLNLANVIYHDWDGKNVTRKSGLK